MKHSVGRGTGNHGRRSGEDEQASQYARSLIEARLDPLVTISPDGKITDVDEATIKFTGPRPAARIRLAGQTVDRPPKLKEKDGRNIYIFINAPLAAL